MVPKNCIDIFIERHKNSPSFFEIQKIFSKEIIKKLIEKSKIVWVHKILEEEGIKKNLHQFLEYDSQGIMIYISDENKLTFLITPDKIQNVELLLTQLNRIKK
jgi:hypothetical protein